jgi:hypothetical protein
MKDELYRLFPGREYETGLDAGCGMLSFFEFVYVKNPVLVDISKTYSYEIKGSVYV